MKAHGTKTKDPSWAGEPGFRAGRLRRRIRRSFLTALLVAVAHLPAAVPALADDFERLLRTAESEGTVSVLVTGWRAVTGDEPAQGSRGDGPVAITGDEFVKRLEGASTRISVTRRYENFPVLAMEMDRAALRAAKAYRGGVEVFDDPVLEPLLDESASLVGAPQAWSRGYAGRGLAVAVIDDGADTRHPFLAGRTVFEACFSDVCPNGPPRDDRPGRGLSGRVAWNPCRRHRPRGRGGRGARRGRTGPSARHHQRRQPEPGRDERTEHPRRA